MTNTHEDLIEIEQRNAVRAGAGLPLLSIEAELARLAAVKVEVEFEREFERRKPEFSHLWTGNDSGWTTNMGRYQMVRQQIRKDMRKEAP